MVVCLSCVWNTPPTRAMVGWAHSPSAGRAGAEVDLSSSAEGRPMALAQVHSQRRGLILEAASHWRICVLHRL